MELDNGCWCSDIDDKMIMFILKRNDDEDDGDYGGDDNSHDDDVLKGVSNGRLCKGCQF